MTSLSKCMTKIGLEDHEAAVLRGMVKEHTADGYEPFAAAQKAIGDYIAELETEANDLIGQVEKSLGGQVKAEAKATAKSPPAAKADAPTDPDVRFSRSAPVWFSALSKEVSKISAKAQPSFGWKQQIGALVKQGKVKADEIEWTGLNDFLDTQQGKVTKDTVQAFLDGNGVQVGETMLNSESAQYSYEGNEWQQAIDRAEANNDFDEAERINAAWEDHEGVPAGGGPKYAKYQLPGGKNYRELLLTLPTDRLMERITAINKEIDGPITNNRIKELIAEREKLEAQRTSTFNSGHWDQPNVLAHIRFNERTDASGAKVLFIEEIQSDWGQAGKKKGFADPKAKTAADQISAEMDLIAADRDMPSNRMRDERRWHELARERDALQKRSDGIPAAPFVGKTDAWVALSIKRMIRYAAENGFEKVAFVNGEQSADRYSLSHQIDEMVWGIDPNNVGRGKQVRLLKKDGSEIRFAVDREGVVNYIVHDAAEPFFGKPLDEVIGKAAGEKVMADREGTLQGDGLKIGGEGMKAFYDQIVPKVAKDVLKKLGGQMGTVALPVESTGKYRVEENSDGFAVFDKAGEEVDGEIYQTKKEADEAASRLNKAGVLADLAQPGFTITPDMRETAMQGMPMFSRSKDRSNEWDAEQPSKMDDFIRTMQDKQVDLKRVVQAIRKTGQTIADQWDPYLQEELYHGRTAKQTKAFLDSEMRPLLTQMQARNVTIESLGEYLHARHAPERNEQMAKINPNDPEMQDGGSGMTNAAAEKYMAELSPAQRASFESLAAKVDAINKGTTDLLVSSGLEKQETIDAWNGAYQAYVPLMRDEAGEARPGTGQGFSVKGSASKRALGSKKDVVDILANVALQRERTIVRSEKNRVAKALWGLAAQSPNPDFWLAVDPNTDPAAIEANLVRLGMNPLDAAGVAREPQQRYVDPRTGLVQWRVNPLLRSSPNVVSMRVNGEEKFVVMSENDERAIRMASAVKNLDADQLGRVLSISAKISRWFASINTQWNPIFGVVNFTRDVQGALLNLSTTPLRGKQADVLKNTISALRGIYIDLRDKRAGKDTESAWADLFEEFQREGGQTGFRDMFADSSERGKALETELKKMTEGKAKGAGRAVFDWLTDYNDAMENAIRLASYKVGKDSGLTNQQAASIAKNLTVNFNRKGTAAIQAGALYAFFNASAQGSARLIETLKGPAGKKIIGGGMLLGSMQALMLAAAGFKDDEPPEFIRERNIIIPTGDGKYITIPMPLGLHVIPNLSRIPTEFVLSGFRKPAERLVSLFGVFADAFNPIGNAGLSLQTISPTAIDPLVGLAENRDFAGRPIAREDFNSLSPTPGHTRAKDTASVISRGVSYGLNWMTGGSAYRPGALSPSPDQIDYLIGQVTGGVGRETLKTMQTVTAVGTGEELPTYKIPLLGRFYGDTTGQSAQSSRFYENLKDLNGHKLEIDGRKKNNQPISQYLRENPESRLVDMATKTQREISKLRSSKRDLVEKNAPASQIKVIEALITQRMKILNDRVEALQ